MPENLTDEGWVTLRVPVPPELVKIGVAEDLQRFFDGMIYKLRRNAFKGRWADVPLDKAFEALRGEVEELERAIAHGSTAEVWMEAADVANQALIASAIALEAKARTADPAEGRPSGVVKREEISREFPARDGPIRRFISGAQNLGARWPGL